MFGMSEEQFWRANPRIIKVWNEAWKMSQNRENQMMHTYTGAYMLSAMSTAIENVMAPMLGGKRGKAKYIEKPIDIFELTEEEKALRKELEKEKSINQFKAWVDSLNEKYGRKEDKGVNANS